MSCVPALFAAVLLLAPAWAKAQDTVAGADERQTIAVLDMEVVGGAQPVADAFSERLREKLLATGQYRLIDPRSRDAVRQEQTLRQALCQDAACAAEWGRLLGADQVVSGRVIKLDESLWQASARLVEVSSAETVRLETVRSEAMVELITCGTADLARQLAALPPEECDEAPDPSLLERLGLGDLSLSEVGDAAVRAVAEPPEQDQDLWRVFASPIAAFDFQLRFENERGKEVHEFARGTGFGVGAEYELERYWGFGAAYHWGSIDTLKLDLEATPSEINPTSGEFSILSSWLMIALPEGHPWVFPGVGLTYSTHEYKVEGRTADISYVGVSVHLAFAYTFDSGWYAGIAADAGVFTYDLSGSRIDRLERSGRPVIDGQPLMAYAHIGKGF